jgi:hypothetical protein
MWSNTALDPRVTFGGTGRLPSSARLGEPPWGNAVRSYLCRVDR